MISRQDALNAKEGMERYKNQDMQLRVSSLPFLTALDHQSLLKRCARLDGVLVLAHAIAAIIQVASASFPYTSSLMPIASGC